MLEFWSFKKVLYSILLLLKYEIFKQTKNIEINSLFKYVMINKYIDNYRSFDLQNTRNLRKYFRQGDSKPLLFLIIPAWKQSNWDNGQEISTVCLKKLDIWKLLHLEITETHRKNAQVKIYANRRTID